MFQRQDGLLRFKFYENNDTQTVTNINKKKTNKNEKRYPRMQQEQLRNDGATPLTITLATTIYC
jgi:hypothetical protein